MEHCCLHSESRPFSALIAPKKVETEQEGQHHVTSEYRIQSVVYKLNNIGSEPLKYIGDDYHKEFVTLCVQGSRGKVLETFELSATCDGMDELLTRMSDDKWMIMGETSGYSVNLHNYLLANGINSNLVDLANLKLITKSDKRRIRTMRPS